MKIEDLYDDADPKSIEKYSQLLIGSSFKEILEVYAKKTMMTNNELNILINYYKNPKNKGSLGTLIEKHFFMYEPNSNRGPDFINANVELKVTPYEKDRKGNIRAGERLVIGMIPYNREISSDFNTSELKDKLNLLLFVLYFRDRNYSRIDYKIDYSKLIDFFDMELSKDLEIIKSDYEIISNKIIAGKAHELSESDTMYLGACTKGSNAKKSLQPQFYNSEVKAKRRAFSFKQGYMTSIFNKYICDEGLKYEEIIKDKVNIIDFQKQVRDKILKYKGYSEKELRKKFNLEEIKSKDFFSMIVFKILGIKSNNAEELVKSDTVIKSIRLEENGNIKESMSFPTIKFNQFVNEEWEKSVLYHYFSTKRFLFVTFKKNNKGYILEDVIFWNMPIKDLEDIGKKEWLEYQRIIREGIKFKVGKRILNNLPKSSETKVFHIRPHANKAAYLIDGRKYGNGNLESDADMLPNGDYMTKQSFWLNKNYILDIIK